MTRLAILTTETPHHAYFVRELGKYHEIVCTVSETRRAKAPFDTAHPFESERDQFEIKQFFGGRPTSLSDLVSTLTVDDVNGPETLENLKKTTPDLVIVFGTGLIRQALIESFPGRILNLHGGDPEEYRGLDSHLWAIYHGDFDGLVTALHHVNIKLDDGDLIGQKRLEIPRGASLYQLRSINTQACVELVLDAVTKFDRIKNLTGTPQRKKGRSFSFMPTVFKGICVERFRKYTETLP